MRNIWINKHYLTLAAVALALSLSIGGYCQEDILKAKDSRTEAQVGLYNDNPSGNQDWVREYDGRDFNLLGPELFDTYGYNNGTQYWFTARDLIIGDEFIDFGIADRNSVRFSGSTNAMTHRIGTTPAINPWLSAQLSNLTPPPAPLNPGQNWDSFKDLSPGEHFAIDRRVNQLNLYVNPGSSNKLGLTTGWWQEDEEGKQQLLFRAREAQPGVLNNRDRAAVGWPVNRETNETNIGFDFALGKSSALNYRFVNTHFDDNRSDIAVDSTLDFLPLNSYTRIGSTTKSHVVKARSRATDRLSFTGVYINKERTNGSSDIPAGYDNAGGPYTKKNKITTTNLAAVFRATDSLSFTGRWRKLDSDNDIPPLFRSPSTTPANDFLSTNQKSLELEGVYTGISKAFLRAGWERREIDRETRDEELTLPYTSLNTDWNILRVALRYHPLMRLNLAANYENWDGDIAGYTGVANQRTRTNFNATYMLRDNVAIYGDYSRWKESNDQIRFAGVIPDQATNEEEEEERAEAAGQGYKSDFTTANIGAWFALNDRLTLDANYGSVDNESAATWIIGYEPPYLPHLPAQFVPFNSSSTQWSLGANYLTTNRLKLFGRYLRVNSSGASYVNPDEFLGLGPEWTPFKIKQNVWTLGFGYDMSKTDSLSLDFSTSKWTDEVDENNTGEFNLWRLSWAKQY